jgi:hypothetical protein
MSSLIDDAIVSEDTNSTLLTQKEADSVKVNGIYPKKELGYLIDVLEELDIKDLKNFESEKQIYEDQLQQIANISIENDNKKIANLTEIEELKKQQLKPKQDKIKELQERIKSRLDELAYQRKNAIAIEQEEFMVIKEESFVKKTKVNVIFRQNKQSKYFELIIKSAEKEQKDMEVLYFVKVKEYKKFEKKKFRFEYLQSDNDKNKVFVFDMDILLIDYFYDKFHEFYRTAKNYHIDM